MRSHSHPLIDTIYAPASAPGRAGVAVLRVSGPGALAGLAGLIPGQSAPAPRRAALRRLVHPRTGLVIDQGIIVAFAAPASFTGEDVVEYHLHGGPAIMRMMLDALSTLPGHRMADPGEFTRRGFENNKMDLTGAEAIADLINAETELQQQQALAQMGGALSTLYEGWRNTLSRALAHLEADIDFPDEDLPDGVGALVMPVLKGLFDDITIHLDDNRRGERLRDGLQVVVIGAPNAGKSSLVNALAQRDIAIVSEYAGTTRDVLEAHLNLGGLPVILVDTAGLRPDQLSPDAQGSIEGEGIRRAIDRARSADLKILLFDAHETVMNPHTLALADDRSIIVMNKVEGAQKIPDNSIAISVRDNKGLDQLTAAIIEQLHARIGSRTSPSLTRERHRAALRDCIEFLARAMQGTVPELMAEDVRLAMRALGRITGRVDVEDLLDIIFRDFCIGK